MITYLIIGTASIISFLCFDRRHLLNRLSFCPYAIFRHQEWYRIVTHGFVHADTMHLLVNMFTLWSFGTYMESMFEIVGFGKLGFLGLYFGGMIFASMYDLFKYRDNIYYQSIGASGAVSAVLFSSILFDPWGKIYFFAVLPIPGIIFGVLYLGYCQYMARNSADNINHNAHFYGALFGLLFPVLLRPSLFSHFLEALGLL